MGLQNQPRVGQSSLAAGQRYGSLCWLGLGELAADSSLDLPVIVSGEPRTISPVPGCVQAHGLAHSAPICGFLWADIC